VKKHRTQGQHSLFFSKLRLSGFIILSGAFLFLFASSALAGELLNDDLNVYNNGNLSGQGDWLGDNEAQIQDATTQEGVKACQINNGAVNWTYNTQADQDDGTQTFYIRAADTTHEAYSYFYEGATLLFRVALKSNGKIITSTSSADEVINDYSADTWYKISTEWRSTDHHFRVSVDDASTTAWTAPTNNWASGVNTIKIAADGGSFFWDSFGAGASTTATTTSTSTITDINTVETYPQIFFYMIFLFLASFYVVVRTWI